MSASRHEPGGYVSSRHKPSSEVPDLAPLAKMAIIWAFLSFIIPFAGSVIAFILAIAAKIKLADNRENRTSRGVATIAQVTAAVTAVMYGAFVWYAEARWG